MTAPARPRRITVGVEDSDHWARITHYPDGRTRIAHLEGVVTVEAIEIPTELLPALGAALHGLETETVQYRAAYPATTEPDARTEAREGTRDQSEFLVGYVNDRFEQLGAPRDARLETRTIYATEWQAEDAPRT
ncbi:hypothetical protein [Microbacterium sp. 77mftsu3.1]|uniref:hypothetical protein n=1 Tax=Microbacterium sp. 77mftsu3.1 TaxID=1761802 RepID=UPI000376B4A1|nr:hypothetical protein [Microbacterium sp. 77mftsu3.1]SDH56398.1 hypothetical protein SAMN04488590_3590 [Microbacterium sp. 77mftsu3.1]